MSGRTPDEGRYSKVSRRMWDDQRFRALSKPPPNAQTLWQRILTGPELGCIPGLFRAREGGLADDLEWPLEDFRRCWLEIAAQKMAEADWRAGLVWVPNGIVHNAPQSSNVIVGWRVALTELPECDLKRRAIRALRAYIAQMGETWAKAFKVACGEPLAKASPKPKAKASPKPSDKPIENPIDIQEQEQEQEQDRNPAAPPDLVARAKRVLENPHDGQYESPSRWPEVVAIAKAWSEPFGIKDPKLRDFPDGDRDLKAILLAIADGYTVEELVSLGAKAAADPWFKGLNKPGPSTFSAAVIRRLIADRPASAKAETDDAAGWA